MGEPGAVHSGHAPRRSCGQARSGRQVLQTGVTVPQSRSPPQQGHLSYPQGSPALPCAPSLLCSHMHTHADTRPHTCIDTLLHAHRDRHVCTHTHKDRQACLPPPACCCLVAPAGPQTLVTAAVPTPPLGLSAQGPSCVFTRRAHRRVGATPSPQHSSQRIQRND